MDSLVLPEFLTSLLAHLCQATLLGLLIATLLLSSPLVSARFRYGLAWIGLAKFMLPLALLGIPVPAGTSRLMSGGWLPALLVTDNPSPGSPAWFSGDWFWRAGVLCWLLGLIAFATIATWRALHFNRQLRADRQPFEPAARSHLAALARSMGINPGQVSGWLTSTQTTPGVSGIFRSRIHVPRELLHSLSPDETEAVLLHELAHIARRDNLWRLLQTVIVCVCWFHPLVWWLHRRLILESERACDEAVVRRTRDREAYAHGLFKAARFSMGWDVPGFSGMARSGLSARLASVLKPNQEKDHPMLRLIVMLVIAVGFVGTSGAVATDTPAEPTVTYDLTELDVAPQIVSQVRPEYPKALRVTGTEGKTLIEFTVDAAGDVKNSSVVKSTHPEFEAPSIAAVRQWKFKPGMKGGNPVNTRLQVPIVFSLNPGKK